MSLNPKQARFVDEYLVDLNATQAAIRAGYSERTAESQGSRLLSNANVAREVATRQGRLANKLEVTQERVLSEIARMAFYDPADIMLEVGEHDAEGGVGYRVSDDGKIYGLRGPTDIRNLPEDVRRAIVGWGWDKNQNFTVKLADKSKALDQLARHLALYNDKLTVNVNDGLADRVRRAKERGALPDGE